MGFINQLITGGAHIVICMYIYIAGYICQSLMGYIIYNTVSLNIHVMHLEWTCSINTPLISENMIPIYSHHIFGLSWQIKNMGAFGHEHRKHLELHMFSRGVYWDM